MISTLRTHLASAFAAIAIASVCIAAAVGSTAGLVA